MITYTYNMKIRKLLAENLKNFRKQSSFTQEKLAEYSDLSLRMIQDIEYEHVWPSPETLEKIAKALKIDESYLFRNPRIKPLPKEALDVIASIVDEYQKIK